MEACVSEQTIENDRALRKLTERPVVLFYLSTFGQIKPAKINLSLFGRLVEGGLGQAGLGVFFGETEGDGELLNGAALCLLEHAHVV